MREKRKIWEGRFVRRRQHRKAEAPNKLPSKNGLNYGQPFRCVFFLRAAPLATGAGDAIAGSTSAVYGSGDIPELHLLRRRANGTGWRDSVAHTTDMFLPPLALRREILLRNGVRAISSVRGILAFREAFVAEGTLHASGRTEGASPPSRRNPVALPRSSRSG